MDWLSVILRGSLYHLAERAGGAVRCRSFARELQLLMYKACFRRLPEGKCLQYVIYTKHLTREQLCPLIDSEMLAQMDACTQVSRQELHVKLLSYTIDEKIDMSAAVTMAVSVHFEGRLPDAGRFRCTWTASGWSHR